MIEIKLNEDFLERYNNFIKSDVFNNQNIISKSIYWEHHSKLIELKINKGSVFLGGVSGNYIPLKKNFLNYYFYKIKVLIKKLIRYKINQHLSYEKAFDKVLNFNLPGKQQLVFDKQKLILKKSSECKSIFPFNYEINDHIIRSYYYLNILSSYIENLENLNIIEIGGGNGNLISLLKFHLKPNCIINIDIPETLKLCIPYLKDLFPLSKMLLPNEIKKNINKSILEEYDIIFLTPSQLSLVEDNNIDLFLNTASFQEMNMEQIKIYIDFIQNIAKKNSYFFCSNSIEKVPVDGVVHPDKLKEIKPIRFFEYPFYDNEVLVYQVCKLTSLVQNNPAYIRFEKII